MNVVHIASPEGKREVYPENQVHDIWHRGLIPDTSLYWQPGMVDWRPVNEYFHHPPRLAAPPDSVKAGLSFVKDPDALTAFVKFMLWMTVLVAVISVFSDVGQLQLAHSGSMDKVAARANDPREVAVMTVTLAVLFVTAVSMLRWIYWANRNSRGFGAEGMRFTPGWAVGYYFIPILMLFRPYQAMKEIWQVSGDPEHWRLQTVPPLLRWWWGLWLLAGFSGNIAFQLAWRIDGPESLAMATVADLVSTLLHIPLSLVAMSLITTIYQRQRELVRQSDGVHHAPTA